MTATQPSRIKLLAAFAAIYFIWGSTFLAIHYALLSIPPFGMAAARFLVAGVVLLIWSYFTSDVRPEPVHWRHALGIGALMLGFGNAAVVWSELHMSSGLTALIAGSIPFWVVVVNWLRPGGERPHGAVLLGVIVGLIGMVLLIGPSALRADSDVDFKSALILLAGSLAWSIGTVMGRYATVPKYQPLTTGMQLTGGGLLLLVLSLVAGEVPRFQPASFTWQSILALAYLIVFGSIVAFSAYSWLMRVAQPARIATYAYVNPVVALFLGWLIAGEKLSLRTVVAAIVVLSGVVLITTGMNAKSST